MSVEQSLRVIFVRDYNTLAYACICFAGELTSEPVPKDHADVVQSSNAGSAVGSSPCIPVVYQEVVGKRGPRVHLDSGSDVGDLNWVGGGQRHGVI